MDGEGAAPSHAGSHAALPFTRDFIEHEDGIEWMVSRVLAGVMASPQRLHALEGANVLELGVSQHVPHAIGCMTIAAWPFLATHPQQHTDINASCALACRTSVAPRMKSTRAVRTIQKCQHKRNQRELNHIRTCSSCSSRCNTSPAACYPTHSLPCM
jgi:hypothetical protein